MPCLPCICTPSVWEGGWQPAGSLGICAACPLVCSSSTAGGCSAEVSAGPVPPVLLDHTAMHVSNSILHPRRAPGTTSPPLTAACPAGSCCGTACAPSPPGGGWSFVQQDTLAAVEGTTGHAMQMCAARSVLAAASSRCSTAPACPVSHPTCSPSTRVHSQGLESALPCVCWCSYLILGPSFPRCCCCRYNYKLPKYSQLVNALAWRSHMQARTNLMLVPAYPQCNLADAAAQAAQAQKCHTSAQLLAGYACCTHRVPASAGTCCDARILVLSAEPAPGEPGLCHRPLPAAASDSLPTHGLHLMVGGWVGGQVPSGTAPSLQISLCSTRVCAWCQERAKNFLSWRKLWPSTLTFSGCATPLTSSLHHHPRATAGPHRAHYGSFSLLPLHPLPCRTASCAICFLLSFPTSLPPLQDRIVRDATRYAWAAVSEWQSRVGVFLAGPAAAGGGVLPGGAAAGLARAPLLRRR